MGGRRTSVQVVEQPVATREDILGQLEKAQPQHILRLEGSIRMRAW
jgi:hypothetical protein